MKAIIIPVKCFRQSKKRLAAHFSEDTRTRLVEAMCNDFFQMIDKVKAADRIFVVSAEPRALEWARIRGWETIVEGEQIAESHSVDEASRHCAALGINAALRIPIDLPLAEPGDIESILREAGPAPFAVLAPSTDGTGTNALLRAPPELFPSHFGPNSFPIHLAEAERAGAYSVVIHNPRIAADVDEIEDLRAVSGKVQPGSRIAQWLARHFPTG